MLNASLLERTADPAKIRVWFTASFIPTLYFGGLGLLNAFSQRYIVQDDVRQHGFWMERFVDPTLFPNDLIADYYQAVAPVGYKTFYDWMSQLGIDPLLLAKLLPLLLGLITVGYAFWIALDLFPIPLSAFIGSVILTQSIWIEDDLISATPRAFLYPFLFAFLYYLLKRSLLPCLVAIALQALFYPQLALVEAGVLTIRLVSWKNGKLALSKDRFDYWVWFFGIGIVLGLVLTFSRDIGAFGPTPTPEQMRLMATFQDDGRSNFFDSNPLRFWLIGDGGLSPILTLPIAWMSCLLPLQIKRHPLARFISPNIRILLDVLIPSLALFFLAHLLLLKLYVPSRYIQHSWRFIMPLAAGIVVVMLLDTGRRWLQESDWQSLGRSRKNALKVLGIFLILSILIPAFPPLFLKGQNQIRGHSPEVYEFFAQQPKDILIASLSPEGSVIPTFSRRSILTGREYAIAYHLGYYNQIEQRTKDLIQAHYSPRVGDVKNLIKQYGINFFLIDTDTEINAFTPKYFRQNPWLMEHQPEADEAIARLQQPRKPALLRLIKPCSVLNTEASVVVDARCITGI
ncbi:hypothetical protein H6G89_00155 [Oscillatoria sp. FACHB-1407]|uniref:hypothetical protein n=1 Tax=Oscillatoria sp. FACHB-1407 TaxID=2692847 RepID=UPI0016883E22|nr:hypothetical protein [Oscillatoria sp. FACHB-1407]MBD2459443.1 hypothetical protein [Oscillatoria sp. FACHB-1407]